MSETTTEAKPQKIFEALAGAMRDVEAVGKDRVNDQQHYKFRGIDDVYNVVHAALSKHGIVTPLRVLSREVAERQTKAGGMQLHVTLKVEYDFVASDGSKLTVGPLWSEALDTSDKATNKAMAFAHKYALLQTFCIPTEDVSEGDRTTIEAAPKRGLDAIPRKAQVPLDKAVERMAQGAPASDFVEPPPVDENGEVLDDGAPPDFEIPFGKNKGKKASLLPVKDLEWYFNAFTENASDPAKSRFRADNLAKAAAVRSIIATKGAH